MRENGTIEGAGEEESPRDHDGFSESQIERMKQRKSRRQNRSSSQRNEVSSIQKCY